MTMNATVNRKAAAATDWAFLKAEKGWKLAEKQWYCHECGFVSASEIIITGDDEADCRCGMPIERTAF